MLSTYDNITQQSEAKYLAAKSTCSIKNSFDKVIGKVL